MSYEFHLSDPQQPDVDGQTDDSPFNSGPIDPAMERRKQDLADALIKANPELEKFRFNYQVIADSQGVSLDEARKRWRHIELNGSEEGNGIQITVFDSHITISVPFWHSGPEAVATIREIWQYMELLGSIANMQPFDPQLGRTLELAEDFDTVLRRYGVGVGMLDQ